MCHGSYKRGWDGMETCVCNSSVKHLSLPHNESRMEPQIGQRVEVYWPGEGKYYPGVVCRKVLHYGDELLHKIRYDANTGARHDLIHLHDMTDHEWRVIDAGVSLAQVHLIDSVERTLAVRAVRERERRDRKLQGYRELIAAIEQGDFY